MTEQIQQTTIHYCSHLRPVITHHGHWFHVNTNGELSPISCIAGVFKTTGSIPLLTLDQLVDHDNSQQVWLDTLEIAQ